MHNFRPRPTHIPNIIKVGHTVPAICSGQKNMDGGRRRADGTGRTDIWITKSLPELSSGETKRGYFWPTSHIFKLPGKSYKNSFSTYLTHIHVFCSPYWLFLPYQFWKKKYKFIRYGFFLVWFLVLILIRTILEQSINNKMVSKI